MKVISTKHTNIEIAKDQEEYGTLPATRLPDGQVISCWELSDQEIQQVIATRRIYLHQYTFNQALQPVMIRAYQQLDLFYPYKMRFTDTSFAVCIASLIGRNAPEDLFNLQDSFFVNPENIDALVTKFQHLCHTLTPVPKFPANGDDRIYIIAGNDPRKPGAAHFCLWQNGELIHDPHPANDGVNSLDMFYLLTKDE